MLIRRSGGGRLRLIPFVGGRPLPESRLKRPWGLSPRVNDRVLCSAFGRGSVAGAGDSGSGVSGGVVPVID
jgi:hypothetical protein